jgi:hypothetical protein
MDQTKQILRTNGPTGPITAPGPGNAYFGLLPKEFQGRVKDPFVYNLVLAVNATSTNSGSTQIQNDSDFVWTQGVVTVTDAAGTTFTNAANIPATINISDSSSGRSFSDQPVAMSSWFGTAQLPFYLQVPKIFRAGGQISATIQSFAAGALTFRVSYHGFKVFAIPAQ